MPIIVTVKDGVNIYECLKDDILSLSLGQNQEERAYELIEQGKQEGKWVVLQNCHLLCSWMEQLESIVIGMQYNERIDLDFRLVLTTLPTDKFSPLVLSSSLKVTVEPPNGVRTILTNTYPRITLQGKHHDRLAKLDQRAVLPTPRASRSSHEEE